MTKALIEFTPDHHDKQQEAMARYHAKLDTLRSVLIECAPRDGKDILESIAESISAAFDKIELTPANNDKSEEKDNEFERLIRPVIKYLAENHHPHTHIVVTSTHAELSEGVQAVATDEYLPAKPSRGQMIEYVQQAIREGYSSYYGLPINGICWLSDDCLKVDYGAAWEYYNLAADENGKAPLRGLGE